MGRHLPVAPLPCSADIAVVQRFLQASPKRSFVYREIGLDERPEALVNVLDGIRGEAKGSKYEVLYRGSGDIEATRQARSRAYIHLYLKVMYGIRDFSTREAFITDGSGDGGIDGYFIDTERKTIVLIQSKFRNSEANFEGKPISVHELLAMEIRRILDGEAHSEAGVKYNGKIQGLQRRIDELPDSGRYSYEVLLIANIKDLTESDLKRLADGFPVTVFDYQRSYSDLLFPVLSGTLFRATGLNVTLDLSNKSSGSKIGYFVETDLFDCEITVVFVPTLEIARLMSDYKNSLLHHNPRSYLEFEGEKVNEAIRESVIRSNINDFAMLNNGITIVCDESSINENSGRKNKAKLFMLNPQIINGGQTAYTLSRVYDETEEGAREALFAGKEVLVKAIAIVAKDQSREITLNKNDLIDRISHATNSQTTVTQTDRFSNDPLLTKLQAVLFETYGILLERKRGEFGEAVRQKYIQKNHVLTRVEFFRIYFASNGALPRALRKKQILTIDPDDDVFAMKLERFNIGKAAFTEFTRKRSVKSHRGYIEILPKVTAALAFVDAGFFSDADDPGTSAAKFVDKHVAELLEFAAGRNARFVRKTVDLATKAELLRFSEGRSQYDQFGQVVSAFVEAIRASSARLSSRRDSTVDL